MPLYHNDDQAMLKDSVAPFVAEQAPVSHLRKLRDEADATGFSRDLWAQFTEMGLPGMLVPEAHGGLGMGHMEAGIVLEEIGRRVRVPLVLHGGTGIPDEDFRRAVSLGVHKINVATAIFDAMVTGAAAALARETPTYFDLNEKAVEAVYTAARHHIEIFSNPAA